MRRTLVQIGICALIFGLCLYSYLDMQNALTQMQMELPRLEQEIQALKEEERRLLYEVDRLESPSRLIELAHRPEFSHLRHPILKEILMVPEAFASNELP